MFCKKDVLKNFAKLTGRPLGDCFWTLQGLQVSLTREIFQETYKLLFRAAYSDAMKKSSIFLFDFVVLEMHEINQLH